MGEQIARFSAIAVRVRRVMVAFVFVVLALLALGLVGAAVEGLLWLTAISVVLILVAIAYVSRRFRTTDGT